MKKFLSIVVAVAMFAFPAFAAEEVLVGEISTSTGDFAAYGFAEVESVKIALEESNAAGGVKVGDAMLPMRVMILLDKRGFTLGDEAGLRSFLASRCPGLPK